MATESDSTEQTEDVSALRKAAESGRAAQREADMAKRELQFVKAGIDTDSKPAQALLNSYEGDLTAEAIQAEAKEWGLIKEAAPPQEPEFTADEQHQTMRDAANGAPAPDTKPEVPAKDRIFSEFLQEREDGRSQGDATNRAIGKMIQAAAGGDKSAVFNESAWVDQQNEAGHGAQFAK